MNTPDKTSLEKNVEKVLFVTEQIIPLIVLGGVLIIFCTGVIKLFLTALPVELHAKKSMTPILWSSGKSMLIFTAVGLILLTTFHMVKFSLYVQITDVLDAVILAAYAITLIGAHRGIDVLLKEEALHLDTYILFGFLAVGGSFIIAMLFVKRKLQARSSQE